MSQLIFQTSKQLKAVLALAELRAPVTQCRDGCGRRPTVRSMGGEIFDRQTPCGQPELVFRFHG